MLLYVCRDYGLAHAAFDDAVTSDPRLASRALGAQSRRAARVGWTPEARETVERLSKLDPSRLRWHVEALHLAARAQDYEAALDHADAALQLEPDAPKIVMERAGILAALGRDEEAAAAAEAAAQSEPGSMPFLLEAARIGFEVGAYEMAQRELEAAAQLDPRDLRPHISLATLALFASDLQGASRALAPARELEGDHPLVLRTEAALDVLSWKHADAIDKLDRVLAVSPDDAEAYTWLAEARLRLGDYEGTYLALHHATMRSDGYLLPAWIMRALGRMQRPDDPDHMPSLDQFRELSEGVAELVPDAYVELSSGDRRRAAEVLERALDALGGNRTPQSSHVVDGKLRRLSARTTPRHASRRALQLIRSASPPRALAALDAVVARYPESSLPICHRGELYLWLGDLDRARSDLDAAIAIKEGTRWAWIGLTGIENLEGRFERALEVSARGVAVMNDTVGNSVYAYRADAAAALGRLDEALADLETSVALSKTRFGAWVSLVAVLDARGQHARAAEVFAKLVDWAPGILSDAAREEGVTLFETRELSAGLEERQEITRAILRLLGGNRSSTCVTYRTTAGRLRLVPYPGGRRPHDTDADDLEQVRTLLLRATGQEGPRR